VAELHVLPDRELLQLPGCAFQRKRGEFNEFLLAIDAVGFLIFIELAPRAGREILGALHALTHGMLGGIPGVIVPVRLLVLLGISCTAEIRRGEFRGSEQEPNAENR
jgi:hypothetical protein